MFKYIKRNGNSVEVISYSVGGGYLYFSGTQGVDMFAGKVNLTTLAYEELEFGQKITSIISY